MFANNGNHLYVPSIDDGTKTTKMFKSIDNDDPAYNVGKISDYQINN